jgi:membrane-associated phospholipid phosphatase
MLYYLKNFLRNNLKQIILLLLINLSTSQSLLAINSEKLGDALFLSIPSLTLGTTLYFDNQEGQKQFYKSFASNTLLTYGLKYSINRQRPNGESHSFPSGHTSTTFQSASFIHKRYGLKYALPAYLGATFVGYSRVTSNNHHITDVLAGAIIGSLSSFYFTTPYKNLKIKPIIMNRGYGLSIQSNW